MVRVLCALALALVVALVPAAATWAAPSPAPTPTSGNEFVARTWRCEGTQTASGLGGTTNTAQDCAVTSWAEQPPRTPYPVPPTSVAVTSLPPVLVGGGSLPLPVREVSPRPTDPADSVSLQCGGSPSGGSSPSAAPTPTASPSSEPAPTDTACRVTAAVDSAQWIGLSVVLGSLLLLGLFTVLRREGRAIRSA